MALPIVKTLADCADFSKTISPFISQLYSLPNDLLASVTSTASLTQLYLSTNPVISGFAISVALFPIFLVISEIRQNYSQVDCFWPILPTLYHLHFALWARLNGLPTQRLDNVVVFSLIWGTRLTYNYWRRGGYNWGAEDYRWPLIKKQIGGVAMFVLNVTFISSLQSVLLFSVTAADYILLLVSRIQPELSLPEIVLARALIGLVVVEYFADQQMWTFQSAKKTYQETAKVPPGWTRAQLDRGFITTGLWKYSRHPNFAAEQTIWMVLYTWSCVASGSLWNWTVAGTISYLLIFQGSTPLTERISAGKYPDYKLYQQKVGQFVPSPLAWGWDEEEMEKVGGKGGKKQS